MQKRPNQNSMFSRIKKTTYSKEVFHIMENPVITEHRIRGERFYTIEQGSKIAFYTRNVAAARYWVKHVIDGASIPAPVDDLPSDSPP